MRYPFAQIPGNHSEGGGIRKPIGDDFVKLYRDRDIEPGLRPLVFDRGDEGIGGRVGGTDVPVHPSRSGGIGIIASEALVRKIPVVIYGHKQATGTHLEARSVTSETSTTPLTDDAITRCRPLAGTPRTRPETFDGAHTGEHPKDVVETVSGGGDH